MNFTIKQYNVINALNNDKNFVLINYETYVHIRGKIYSAIQQKVVLDTVMCVYESKEQVIDWDNYKPDEPVLEVQEEHKPEAKESSDDVIVEVQEEVREPEPEECISRGVICESDAGCGKTYFMAQISKTNQNLLYLVFNKKNQLEAEKMIEFRHNTVLTFHKFAIQILRQEGFQLVNNQSLYSMFKKWNNDESYLSNKMMNHVLNNNLTEVTRENSREYNTSQIEWGNTFINYLKQTDQFTLTECLYILANRVQEIKLGYSSVCIDEFQDMDQCQMKIIKTIVESNVDTKFIVVGDKKQTIYQFRGCGVLNNFEIMKSYLQKYQCAKLQTCYRSSQNILDFVNEECQTQTESSIGYVENSDIYETIPNEIKQYMVISRLNVNSLGYYAQNIDNEKVGCHYDFEKIVKDVMRGQKYYDGIKMDRVISQLDVIKIEVQEDDQSQLDARGNAMLKESFRSIFMYYRSNTVKQFLADCDNRKNKAEIIVSTIHKSKGLEHDNVVVLNHEDLFEAGMYNLKYVALTRAKLNLILM